MGDEEPQASGNSNSETHASKQKETSAVGTAASGAPVESQQIEETKAAPGPEEKPAPATTCSKPESNEKEGKAQDVNPAPKADKNIHADPKQLPEPSPQRILACIYTCDMCYDVE